MNFELLGLSADKGNMTIEKTYSERGREISLESEKTAYASSILYVQK